MLPSRFLTWEMFDRDIRLSLFAFSLEIAGLLSHPSTAKVSRARAEPCPHRDPLGVAPHNRLNRFRNSSAVRDYHRGITHCEGRRCEPEPSIDPDSAC